MTFIAVAIGTGAASLGGALISSNAAGNAAQTQANAANSASQLQYQEWEQQQKNQQPFLQAGQSAIGQMGKMAANPVSFTPQDFQNNMDPSYQFELQQGQQALQRSAAASGGLQSGGTMKAMAQYTQGMASTGYQQAYSNYMNNQNTQFNRLASVAGAGQTSAGQLMQGGSNYAGQVGQNMMGAANAMGASQIAQGNTMGSALSGLGSGVAGGYLGYQQQQTMNNWLQSLQPGGGGGSSGYAPGTAAGYGVNTMASNPGAAIGNYADL